MNDSRLGFSFTEIMRGGFVLGQSDPATDAKEGKSTVLTMHGTIAIDDLAAFMSDPNHLGSLEVRMDWPPFGADLPSSVGIFNLFSPREIRGSSSWSTNEASNTIAKNSISRATRK